jgi:hypothetical protein
MPKKKNYKRVQQCHDRERQKKLRAADSVHVTSSSEEDESDSDGETFEGDFEDIKKELLTNSIGLRRNALVDTSRPLSYHGNSERTQFRRKAEIKRSQEKCPTPQITSFFVRSSSPAPRPQAVDDSAADELEWEREVKLLSEKDLLKKCLQKLEEETTIGISQEGNQWNTLRHLAVRRYFEGRLEGKGKVALSQHLAKILFSGGNYKGTSIREWAKFYAAKGCLPGYHWGCHQKTQSFVEDEDFREKCLIWLRSKKEVFPADFHSYLVQELLPAFTGRPKHKLTVKTTRKWLRKLGWELSEHKQGAYFDGMDRPEVVKSNMLFVSRMFERERMMATCDGDDMEIVSMPDLKPGEKQLIWIVQDESCFFENDGRRFVWKKEGSTSMRKKGNKGRVLHVSDFLCECHGPLKYETLEARVFMKPGKDKDGWWTGQDTIEQTINKAIPIARLLHPGCDLLFTFDHSSGHHVFADDSLVAEKMNLNPGGQQPVMRDGFYEKDGNRVVQAMTYPNDYEDADLAGKPKGIKLVLQERGLWPSGKFNLRCTLCSKGAKEDPDRETRTECCAVRLLGSQPDFKAQQCKLAETLSEYSGVECDFFAKFFAAVNNWIEPYWGDAKRDARNECDYTFSGLEKKVPEVLDRVPVSKIRRYARKAWRYMDAQKQGLTGRLADYAVRKYRSHRRVPTGTLQALEEEFLSKKNPVVVRPVKLDSSGHGDGSGVSTAADSPRSTAGHHDGSSTSKPDPAAADSPTSAAGHRDHDSSSMAKHDPAGGGSGGSPIPLKLDRSAHGDSSSIAKIDSSSIAKIDSSSIAKIDATGDGSRAPIPLLGTYGVHKLRESVDITDTDDEYDFEEGMWVDRMVVENTAAEVFLQLRNVEKDILEQGHMLTDNHLHAAGRLLKAQFPFINGFQDTTLAMAAGMNTMAVESIQFHNNAQLHWLLSTSIGGTVKVFDSIYRVPNNSMRQQLRDVYRTKAFDGAIQVQFPACQKQNGGVDCGLFAIAFAVELCELQDPALARFDQSKMRGHLKTCFEQGQFRRFPKIDGEHVSRIRMLPQSGVAVKLSG